MRPLLETAIASLLTLLLLGGVWVDKRLFRAPAADAEPYHERVRALAQTIPTHSGSWLSSPATVPPSAVALLKPNVIISRRYQDLATGKVASLLLVQCKDARDLLGHWPPVCYAGQGWIKKQNRDVQWQFEDLTIPGVQYEFTSDHPGRSSLLCVDDFFVLPDGRFCRHMDEVDANARNPRKKRFGAAQVQIVTDGSLTMDEREAVLGMFVRSARPFMDAIREGVTE